MKILIDTNILWSAYFYSGHISKLMQQLTLLDDVYLSTYSLQELTNKIFNKIHNDKNEWKKIINIIEKIMLEGKFKILLIHNTNVIHKTRDSKDDPIVNCAVKNNMDLLVTGDKDLLEFKNSNIRIVKFNEWLSYHPELQNL